MNLTCLGTIRRRKAEEEGQGGGEGIEGEEGDDHLRGGDAQLRHLDGGRARVGPG